MKLCELGFVIGTLTLGALALPHLSVLHVLMAVAGCAVIVAWAVWPRS